MPTYLQPDEWISLALAASILGCDVKTVRRRVSEGVLPAQRFGPRLIRLRRSDVDALGQPLQTFSSK